ncbi:MAG: helix-turn-helix domain-containing protein [Nitrospinota bacterium]|nr:MAG: helix-turn-helix domain-containing protein [Nitrospinota bacterium]
MVESLGEFLKRERELRNVSLEEISSATKISIRYLEALEREEYDLLPAEAFVKGFLRAYARHIGIDPDEVILLYQENKAHLSPPVKPAKSPATPPGPLGSKVFLGSLCSLLFLIGVLFYFFLETDGNLAVWQEVKGLISSQEASPPPVPEAPSSQSLPLSQRLPALQTNLQPGQETSPPLAGGSAGEEGLTTTGTAFTVAVTALFDTWLRVTVDGEQQDLLLLSGQTERWQAQKEMVLSVGNVRGTRLTINGKPLVLPPTSGNILKDFVITRAMVPEKG